MSVCFNSLFLYLTWQFSLTPNELGGGLGKEAGQTNQEWRKNTIRMQGTLWDAGRRSSSTKNRTR
ncbi:hypothetical protein HanRHA438_Chr02g0080771 [Helianthus annuus]|nr:hypothetical protein HanRHA438_Chr02g0080771 [Helianthus annuus]